jgi:hypothetical protein
VALKPQTRAPAHSVLAATVVAACLGLFASAANSQTINFGHVQGLSDGPITPGYAGFNWGSAVNDPYDGGYGLTEFAASIDQFSRNTPFDLNSVTFQNLVSEGTGDTLVSSVTENYGAYSDPTFAGLNIDDVNKITFSTNALLQDTYCCDAHGNIVTQTNYNGPDSTYVSSLTVGNFASAPELNGSSAATALTLLLGSLAVLRGRRARWRAR